MATVIPSRVELEDITRLMDLAQPNSCVGPSLSSEPDPLPTAARSVEGSGSRDLGSRVIHLSSCTPGKGRQP